MGLWLSDDYVEGVVAGSAQAIRAVGRGRAIADATVSLNLRGIGTVTGILGILFSEQLRVCSGQPVWGRN